MNISRPGVKTTALLTTAITWWHGYADCDCPRFKFQIAFNKRDIGSYGTNLVTSCYDRYQLWLCVLWVSNSHGCCPPRRVIPNQDWSLPNTLWWWFWPCRVGGTVWFHVPSDLFSIHIFSLVINMKNSCENNKQFMFGNNLLPLALVWRSAPCLKHWNQRWFGDNVLTMSSGKQWDHGSPWSPSWFSAGTDECCRNAKENVGCS